MHLPQQTLVPIGENGEHVSADLLMTALGVEIGTAVGTLSMDPALAQRVAELTENPNWKHIAAKPTLVTRQAQDLWKVRVGDFENSFSGGDIISALTKALRQSLEGN